MDLLLSRAGLGSRSVVKDLVRKGRVTVAGRMCKDPGHQVSGEEICVNGRPVVLASEVLTLILHKPVGHSCSHDAREAPLVEELLPEVWRRRKPEMVGRLDRATSGLLLLTTDGTLIHRLAGPKHAVKKRYRVAFDGELTPSAGELFATGMLLSGESEKTRPAELRLEAPGRATVVITEGKYHQVRRMVAAVGGTVLALHRDQIGELALPEDLQEGEVREATEEEISRALRGP